MNPDFYRLMRDATDMTRSGQLGAATQAIQRALAGGMGAVPTTAPSPSPAPTPAFTPASAWAPARAAATSQAPAATGMVLDGLTRIVADAEVRAPVPAPAPAPATAKPVPPAAPACAQERWIDGSFSHQGRTVAYKLFVPAPVPAPDGGAGAVPPEGRPLVVMLHGCTQNAADFAAGTQMNALAKAQGALVLYPEQNPQYNPQRCWNWFKPQHQQRGRGEPALLAALAQSIVADYQGDPARVYVAGLSAGGAMADVLGHCYPDVFAAVGVHSGLPVGAATDMVSALAAMRAGPAKRASPSGAAAPTIVFHGDADSTVHARNGAAIADAAHPAGTTGTTMPVTGHRATRTVYDGPGGRSTAEYWQLHGVGHAWSGGSAQGSYTHSHGVNASAEMLRFFMQHQRPG